MQNRLQQVVSPSSSKPDEAEDDYYMEDDGEIHHVKEEGTGDETSNVSIPMAHREYEKILRQLEAECRTHIKCEQQMKLHIECLQEKLDNLQKEIEANKKGKEDIETEKMLMQQEVRGLRASLDKKAAELTVAITQMKQVKESLDQEKAICYRQMQMLEERDVELRKEGERNN